VVRVTVALLRRLVPKAILSDVLVVEVVEVVELLVSVVESEVLDECNGMCVLMKSASVVGDVIVIV